MIERGVLYEHARRPEWGVGLLVADLGGGKFRFRFTVGGERTLGRVDNLRPAELDDADVELAPTRPIKPARSPRRKRNDPRMWTAEQLERVRELGEADEPVDTIAAELGKSRDAVRAKLRALGIAANLGGAYKHYSADEDRIVRDGTAAGLTDAQIAEQLPARSVASVHLRRKTIGLRKPNGREWSPAELAELERLACEVENFGRGDAVYRERIGEIAQAFGRSRNAIRAKLSKLGLRGGK